MKSIHHIYLISDSTGETIDRIFMALKAQFKDFKYEVHQYSFTTTENQIKKIIDLINKDNNPIILYTIVDDRLAKFLAFEAKNKKVPCFGALGDLILNFSKLLLYLNPSPHLYEYITKMIMNSTIITRPKEKIVLQNYNIGQNLHMQEKIKYSSDDMN